MSEVDVCPACGSERDPYKKDHVWICGTKKYGDIGYVEGSQCLRNQLATAERRARVAERAAELIENTFMVGCLKALYMRGERHNWDMDCSDEQVTIDDGEHRYLDVCPTCHLAQAYAIAESEIAAEEGTDGRTAV